MEFDLDLKALIAHCESGIEKKIIPGAAFAVGNRDSVQFGYAGRHRYDAESPRIGPDTIFDLASLSKVIGTTTAAMIAFDDGLFKLDDPVARYLQDYASPDREKITIRDLLLHQSGLPAYKNFVGKGLDGKGVRSQILSEKFVYACGDKAEYSCLGFITLQSVLDKVFGESFDKVLAKRVWGPLGMSNTIYCPTPAIRDLCAPTEKEADWRDAYRRPGIDRRDFICGDVHDPIAYMLGGLSGNAGLFSTIGDIAKFAQLILNSGASKAAQILCAETVRTWTTKQSKVSTRAYGWDTKSPNTESPNGPISNSSSGVKWSAKGFGHTGYTGTSIWFDPDREIFACLLTNRAHPDDSESSRNAMLKFRQGFHDLT